LAGDAPALQFIRAIRANPQFRLAFISLTLRKSARSADLFFHAVLTDPKAKNMEPYFFIYKKKHSKRECYFSHSIFGE